MARDIARITAYVVQGPRVQQLIEEVDFPHFVATLIQGVFDAVVNASIEQMKSYEQLLKDVARATDQFARDNVSGEQTREWLTEKYPDPGDDSDDETDGSDKRKRLVPSRRLTATERQRLIVRVTLAGVARIKKGQPACLQDRPR